MKNENNKSKNQPIMTTSTVLFTVMLSTCSMLLMGGNFENPITLGLEISATLTVILVAWMFILHLYELQQAAAQQESELKTQILDQIFDTYPYHPDKILVEAKLQKILDDQPTHNLKLEKLTMLSTSDMALDSLLTDLLQEQASQDVLEDLGLCWEPKTNCAHFDYAPDRNFNL